MCLLCLCPRSMQVFFFLSPLPTNCEGSVPCFQIPRLGSAATIFNLMEHSEKPPASLPWSS